MLPSIFREYDIRGKVNTEFMLDQVYDLVSALAYYFLRENPKAKTVAIGMDGRISSPTIKNEAVRAFVDSGFDVTFIGVCPTPVLYFAAHTLGFDASIMITASHNPQEYNGIKIMLGTKTLWGTTIKEIGQLYSISKKVLASRKGQVYDYPVIPSYIAYLADHFPSLKGMKLAAVIDSGNGAAGTVLPALVAALKWQNVTLLYPEVDGTYPHHEADPVVEKNMQDVKELLAHSPAQIGIGLDGDADRMAAMTKNGILVPADQLFALFVQEALVHNPGAPIIFDVKASAGLIELFKKWQAQFHMSPCGHAIIKEQMNIHSALLAGELSGHFFFHDRYFGYDDGIYAMMRLFEILHDSRKSLEQLLTIFPKKVSTKEIRLACPADKKQAVIAAVKDAFAQNPDVQLITIDGVRVNFSDGWGLVRVSNTQEVISMRFESDSAQGLQKILQEFMVILSAFFDEQTMQQQLKA